MKKIIGDADKKIPDTSVLMSTNVLNTKISEVENKNPNLDTCITTREFNKSIAKKFTARLEQPNLMNKTDFKSKLININKKITADV